MAAFNSRQYEYDDLTVVMGGRDITGIRGISYKHSQEKEVLYAKGNKAHSIQRGNKKVEGTITILQSELEALTAASPNRDVLDAQFNIVVVYGSPSQGQAIVTDIISSVEITEIPKSLKQNDKFMEIELPFIALDVQYQVL